MLSRSLSHAHTHTHVCTHTRTCMHKCTCTRTRTTREILTYKHKAQLKLYYFDNPRSEEPNGVVELRGAIVTRSKHVKMAIEIVNTSVKYVRVGWRVLEVDMSQTRFVALLVESWCSCICCIYVSIYISISI